MCHGHVLFSAVETPLRTEGREKLSHRTHFGYKFNRRFVAMLPPSASSVVACLSWLAYEAGRLYVMETIKSPCRAGPEACAKHVDRLDTCERVLRLELSSRWSCRFEVPIVIFGGVCGALLCFLCGRCSAPKRPRGHYVRA